MNTPLQIAAQAVLDRWNSPRWEWAKHGPTGNLMNDLRLAIDVEKLTPPTLQMTSMESDDGTKSWFIDGPDFYCDIDKKPGETYEVFIRDKNGIEGFSEGKPTLPVQSAGKVTKELLQQALVRLNNHNGNYKLNDKEADEQIAFCEALEAAIAMSVKNE